MDYYFHCRILRWAGHVSRMPFRRLPRKLLTCWLTEPRLAASPQMTWGESLENALIAKNIPVEFSKWSKLAADRPKWRELLSKVPGVSPALAD